MRGLWYAYQDANTDESRVVSSLSNIGQAVNNLQNIDPTAVSGENAIDSLIADFDSLNYLFKVYASAVSTAEELAGEYQKTVWYTSQADYDALSAINKLPTDIAGIKPNQEEVYQFANAISSYATGSDFMLANNNLTISEAVDTHDALERAIQVGGIASIMVSSAEILTEQGMAIFAKAAAQKISNLASSVIISAVVGQNVSYLAKTFGVSENTLRIGADSLQLISLFKAARGVRSDEAPADEPTGVGCFSGDTLVQRGSGDAEAIDQLQVGQRVATNVAEPEAEGGPTPSSTAPTEVDPQTWREVTLDMPDPAISGDEYYMTLLEPLAWIDSNAASPGNWIELNIPELEVSGLARVDTLGACPAIATGAGQVVLGTFEHVSNDVLDVQFSSDSAPLQVTAGHKIWSLDADGWVNADQLYPGEMVAGLAGPVEVESVLPESESVQVFNLDVEYDHRFLVTTSGILVHNADPCVPAFPEVENPYGYVNNNPGATANESNVGTLFNNAANTGELGEIVRFEGNVESPAGETSEPDYKFYLKDGSSGYADLYQPSTTNLSSLVKNAAEKGAQTAGGVVIIRVPVGVDPSALMSALREQIATPGATRLGTSFFLLDGQNIIPGPVANNL